MGEAVPSPGSGDAPPAGTDADAAGGAPGGAAGAGQPYGSWATPITSELVVRAAAGLGDVALDGDDVWWSEMRPTEGGRSQLVRWQPAAGAHDVLPDGANARTAVHEYGGGAWWVAGGRVWFTDWTDQRLRVLPTASAGVTGDVRSIEPVPPEAATPGAGAPVGPAVTAPEGPAAGPAPEIVTSEPEVPRGDRWADGDLAPDGRWLVVVREHHAPGSRAADVVNEIVALDTSGALPPRVLVSGPDFVSDPRFSADGRRLAWLQWDHPDMPWDGSQLVVTDLRWSDIGPGLQHPEVVAGRPTGPDGATGESVSQPRWAPDGSLWFISDRTGWWNLYRWAPPAGYERLGTVVPTVQMDAEIGVPQWVFGQSRYAFLDGGRVAFAYQRDGLDHVAVRTPDGAVHDLDLPYTSVASVQAQGDAVVLVGASVTSEPAVVRVTVDGNTTAGDPEVLRPARDLGLDPAWFSACEPIAFPTTGGRTAHALYYPPTNPEAVPPDAELPPLLVLIHGGPTAAARPMLQLGTQYWTSRGFAVVDVNYGGSTGYGRAYRDQLRDAWGVVDLDDCEAAARHLADTGRADPNRLCIRGGSAGGYTTLAALCFRDTFAAGASHYGVADLEALAIETHKFESRYLDGLIGPYPAARDVYVARSPIHHVGGFDRPLAVFQGLEDEVVPPNQAEMIVTALRDRGVPVAYVPFPGEQHGFRQAANIRRALDGELSFYAQVFGFPLPAGEGIEAVEVDNLD
ncbi:MAG TPA: prolyl oligopeptidase family serine peptidase [Acidimicrobiales bacterium]|nr:prolyl oligopeptidase family serine peptidase [Acidimicrobiales bacterium]